GMTSRNIVSTSRGLCSCSRTRAQNKFCGLAAVIQARMERGQSAGGRDDVSRETIVILFCLS
ncbi:MAG: hypothetical protein II779_17885, partial [Clostridia bacterium]|nr:hypothetical protein [Clostridia bacterium]